MKKKLYVRPTFCEMEIEMNNLCVGSTNSNNCTTIDMRILDRQSRSKTYSFSKNKSKDNWVTNF